jgi:hypothetical protein
MIKDFVAAEGFSACLPAPPLLSPEVADIFVLLRLEIQNRCVCIVRTKRNPTAAIYNRYKERRPVIDRRDAAT